VCFCVYGVQNSEQNVTKIYKGELPERAHTHHSWPPNVIYALIILYGVRNRCLYFAAFEVMNDDWI